MSTTRRTLLAGLASLPVASAPALAHVIVSPDADLIAMARRVTALVRLEDAAQLRECEATERYDKAKPAPVPDTCRAEIHQAWRTEMEACPTAASDEVVQAHAQRAGTAAKLILDRHADLIAAREKACQQIRRETGLDRASNSASWLCERLKAATERLAATEACTMPGLVAKASAFQSIQSRWDSLDEWIFNLSESVTRDVLAIGSAA